MENDVLYEEILKYVREGVYFVDTERKITFWNNHAERITGFTASEVLNRYCYDNILTHVDDDGVQLCKHGCPLHRTIADSYSREAEVYLHHKDGHRVPVTVRTFPLHDQGILVGAIELFSDVKPPTELLKDMEELRVLALTDQLTGLANRRYTESFLAGKLVELEEFGTPFGVALVDIDHFKMINDAHGHDIGDQVITMTAKSLRAAIRSTDLVGRWGGEEFLIVFSAVDMEKLEQMAERMRMLVEASSIQQAEKDVGVTVCIGAVSVERRVNKEQIIRLADKLMYQCKSKGRNQVSVRLLE